MSSSHTTLCACFFAMPMLALLSAGCGEVPRPQYSMPKVPHVETEKVSIASPEAFKAYLEECWPVDRIWDYCAVNSPTDPEMQNLVGDGRYQFGALLHDDVAHDLGVIYWYASSDDGRSWAFSVNAVKEHKWWWLALGGVRSDVEINDDPAFRMNGEQWDHMWKRVGDEYYVRKD